MAFAKSSGLLPATKTLWMRLRDELVFHVSVDDVGAPAGSDDHPEMADRVARHSPPYSNRPRHGATLPVTTQVEGTIEH